MSDKQSDDRRLTVLRRLSLGVWVIAIVLVLDFAYALFPFLFPDIYYGRFRDIRTVEMTSEGEQDEASERASKADYLRYKDFHEWPLEKQIDAASIVARIENEITDDGKVKAVIAEFWRRRADVEFYYEVGDEIDSLSREVEPGVRFGDGYIALFVGKTSPLMTAMTYEGERLRSRGGIKLSRVRELVDRIR